MTLVDSRWLRLLTLSSLYFAQGIPIGLLDIAMPAWLAAQGAAAGDIGVYAGVIGLPWAFKLIAGPFMDRFQFPPMGRRRPWVIAAQTGLLLALAGLAGVGAESDPGPPALLALMVVGFLVNACAATQDVAVDGMAIDVVPEAERGRANAFMAFGQVLGYGVFAGISGTLLTQFGLGATALAAALAVAAILVLSVAARERAGERALPWTAGQAHPSFAPAPASILALAGDLLRALVLPMSLLLTLVAFVTRVALGMGLVVAPVFAVRELGYGADSYSQVMAVVSAAAAVLGLLFGPLIDRAGARRALLLGLLSTAATLVLFAVTPALWTQPWYVLGLLFLNQVCGQVVFIALIAQYMNMNWYRVAATQFAVYMALANLARSAGAGLYGGLADLLDFAGVFLLMGGMLVLAAALLVPFDATAHALRLERLGGQQREPQGAGNRAT
ncbi:MAG: MFS transporter [Pseudomonadales bacterium]